MTNVIALNVPQRRQQFSQMAGVLIRTFAQNRRAPDDVFWLKENAEVLNILECTGTKVAGQDLAVHSEFYDSLPKRLSFFPQYYRFLLSICLDLEDLGFAQIHGEKLCAWAAETGLAQAEFSDLQRAEARRLLARRGVDLDADLGLDQRLHEFMGRSETFALPNIKAAYELTHIVFYLSEYGRRDPQLSGAAIRSLHFAGTLAFLDQNADLLAEICVALRYACQTPSAIWEDFVTERLLGFETHSAQSSPISDSYHEFLVGHWMGAQAGFRGAVQGPNDERSQFLPRAQAQGPLRDMSMCMMRLDDARRPEWSAMQSIVTQAVGDHGVQILAQAQQATPEFEAFFEGFSRFNVAV